MLIISATSKDLEEFRNNKISERHIYGKDQIGKKMKLLEFDCLGWYFVTHNGNEVLATRCVDEAVKHYNSIDVFSKPVIIEEE